MLAREQGLPIFQNFLAPFWGSESDLEKGLFEKAYVDVTSSTELWRSSNGVLTLARGLAIEALALGKLGRCNEALSKIQEALSMTERTGERWHEAETYRIKGWLMQETANFETAEICFRKALSVSRSQHARSWELRAANSLARLWQRKGKIRDAYELLAPVYGWFTEGFDTKDLKEAKALLGELRA